ncbi:MAG: sulfotransferase family 2 domain-containing protein [Boseongicola sp.]
MKRGSSSIRKTPECNIGLLLAAVRMLRTDGIMIISPSRRYIFVHIPKTGGTSLALALEERAKPDDILIGDTPKARARRHRIKPLKSAGRLWKHSRLADIAGLAEAEPLDDYFVFTIVRDPWDRVSSLYHWLRDQTFSHVGVERAKSLSFAGFVADVDIAAMLSHDQARTYTSDATGMDRADTILRFEQIAEDLVPVEKHLGVKIGPLPHLNRSDRPEDSRAVYDAESAKHVARYFAEDISRFGYEF